MNATGTSVVIIGMKPPPGRATPLLLAADEAGLRDEVLRVVHAFVRPLPSMPAGDTPAPSTARLDATPTRPRPRRRRTLSAPCGGRPIPAL